MKKVMSVVFYMMIPTLFAFSVFFLIYDTFQAYLGDYQWLAIIPLTIVTGYIIMENKKEWRAIKEQV
jgi:hypothetical protein